jgi:hypothetical protein
MVMLLMLLRLIDIYSTRQGTDVTSETRAYANKQGAAGGLPVNVLTQGSYRCHLENKVSHSVSHT